MSIPPPAPYVFFVFFFCQAGADARAGVAQFALMTCHGCCSEGADSHSEDTLGKQEREAQRAAKAERRRITRLRKTRRKLLDNKFHNKQKDRRAMDFKELLKLFPEELPVSCMPDLLPDKQRRAVTRGWKKIISWNAQANLANRLQT